MSKATQKSLEKMRKEDLSPWIVERFVGIGKMGIRKDLYNIIDIIGIDPTTKKFIGVQSSVLGQRTEHMKKLTEDCAEMSKLWLSTGSTLQLWSWRKLKKRKKDGTFSKVYTWEPKIDEIKIEDLKFNNV